MGALGTAFAGFQKISATTFTNAYFLKKSGLQIYPSIISHTYNLCSISLHLFRQTRHNLHQRTSLSPSINQIMASPKVIVFGPTGDVGHETAIVAQKQGAKVYLAMRNTTKPINGLTAEQETAGGFERVQADLEAPETVEAAVRKTGAKHAFIYLMMRSPDHMRATIEALKAGGAEFVVFLSSASVQAADPKTVTPDGFVDYAHAQVEVGLEEVFGKDGYAAVRPAYFAKNLFWWQKMIKAGKVTVAFPELTFDWVAYKDIGAVCGTLLAKGAVETFAGEKVVDKPEIYLYGPQLTSVTETLGMLAKVLGKEIEVESVGEEEGVQALVQSGFPEFIAKPFTSLMRERAEEGKHELYEGTPFQEGLANAEKFAGKKPQKLEEFLEEVKGELA
ncbi:NmrA-like family protein [Apodospora peruviana]|uniref:NmrA-like family protein n=1 Tax=Apodospora peruviana TaxID=516989 RepID=A0AAE0HTY2_9PEZI|nr:NmrA-like family protein [Apodospora peruviana]